jgi:hypothetical protein
VLVNARDRIHKGYRLLTHPLYGNFLPNQQPFRTLILSAPREFPGTDPDSLYLIEEALAVFRNYEGRWALPGQLAEAVERDYALIDFDLMQESLRQCGFNFSIEGS